jgi:hypothetical protein
MRGDWEKKLRQRRIIVRWAGLWMRGKGVCAYRCLSMSVCVCCVCVVCVCVVCVLCVCCVCVCVCVCCGSLRDRTNIRKIRVKDIGITYIN